MKGANMQTTGAYTYMPVEQAENLAHKRRVIAIMHALTTAPSPPRRFFAYFVLPLASAPAVNAQHDAGGARDGALAARARHEATQRERQQKLAVQQGEREFEFFWSELKKNADGRVGALRLMTF